MKNREEEYFAKKCCYDTSKFLYAKNPSSHVTTVSIWVIFSCRPSRVFLIEDKYQCTQKQQIFTWENSAGIEYPSP